MRGGIRARDRVSIIGKLAKGSAKLVLFFKLKDPLGHDACMGSDQRGDTTSSEGEWP